MLSKKVFIFAPMRLSAFILNLLMLVMILAPCRDHKALGMGKARTPQLLAAAPTDGQSDDDCSPLCTCSCCASVSPVVYTPVVEEIVSAPIARKFPVYITPYYHADRSAVWQPPRIG
ncbi:MAG TPA: DUF6660 family protein [Puia sp.]|nr:DUF6660 family protein [Puia sp.]